NCARSSWGAGRFCLQPMWTLGRRASPSFVPAAASRRAHEPCPAQMLWPPLPLQAVAPNDVLRLVSASTSPIARPAQPRLGRMQWPRGGGLRPTCSPPTSAPLPASPPAAPPPCLRGARGWIQAGYDPATPLQVYRGALALTMSQGMLRWTPPVSTV